MPCNCRRGTGPHEHILDGAFAKDGAFGVGEILNGQIESQDLKAWNAKENVATIFDSVFATPPPDGRREFVSSDADVELLLHVPFREILRIRGIVILGTNDSFSPASVKLFVNRTDVTGFDSVERLEPQEVMMLANTSSSDAVVYRINPAKFQASASVTLMFTESFGEDETHVSRIEFYGDSTSQPVNRPMATNVVYEAVPNPADHKVLEEGRKASSFIS